MPIGDKKSEGKVADTSPASSGEMEGDISTKSRLRGVTEGSLHPE